jgi:peptide/nickel transport system ATP-binding protein
VVQALARVGLPATLADRKPREISGGQRQRVVLARALVLQPSILVLDEPTSALDVTVQAQVVDLLITLQRELGLTYLFVSHDLSLVRQIADEVSVLEKGRLVETGSVAAVFGTPTAAYTQRLLDAVPGAPARAA